MLYWGFNSPGKLRTFVMIALTAVIALTVIGGSFIQNSRAQGPSTGTVSGVVLGASGVPLPGATVTFRDTLTGATLLATTNSSGAYVFLGVPVTSNGTVTAQAPGTMASVPIPAVVTPGGTTTLPNITLTPMPTTGSVSGVVVSSATGLPISGATATYTDPISGTTATATTSASGTYLIVNLPVSSSGAVTVTAPGSQASAPIPAAVVAGSITALPTITLVPNSTPTGAVSGVVVNSSTGLPISGATVTYNDPLTGVTAMAASAPDGTYAFVGLPVSSTGTVSASAPGTTASVAVPAVVTAGGTTIIPIISLVPTALPSGGASGVIINSSTGLPIAGATVTYTDPVTGTTATATTAPNGSFAFLSLPVSSTGSITASAPGTSASAPVPAPISPSLTTLIPTISLVPNGGVSGTVISGTTGLPLPGATVTFINPINGTPITATTAADGSFTLSGIPVGSSGTITITGPGGGSASVPVPTIIGGATTPLGAPITVTVPIGSGSCSISSRLVNPTTGLGISGITIQLSGTQSGTAVTDSNGNFAFTGLNCGGTFTLTPISPTGVGAGLTFNPPIQVIPNLTSGLTLPPITGTPLGGGQTFTIGGTISDGNGNPVSGATITLSGTQSGSVQTGTNGSFTIPGLQQGGNFTITPSGTSLTFNPGSQTFNNLQANQAGVSFTATPSGNTFGFAPATYSMPEGCASFTVTVTRAGDTSIGATVDYASQDGTARERSDYITTLGTLRFAPGEQSRSFQVLLTEDSKVEGDENFLIVLNNASANTSVGAQNTAMLTITDNSPEMSGNPNDLASMFVCQQYHDFLNRQSDSGGQAFWTKEITDCGNDAACINFKRTNTSGAFFLSIEFQTTGFFVIRTYRTAFSRKSSNPYGTPNQRLTYREFLKDTQEISEGVIVNEPAWEQKLESNTLAYIQRFVNRPDFKAEYPDGMPAAQYVDKLHMRAGVTPTSFERQESMTAYGSGDTAGRAAALRKAADTPGLREQSANAVSEFDPAFVLMEYFGYLRRNPDECGYSFWLAKLNNANGDFHQAEMVRAFLLSDEYRRRFAGLDYTDAEIPVCASPQ
ncbi:MAG: carboxypeptidase regulatory-like domain-containing protein [Acidobacteriota bacterium]|nr:carboxypeptidase regulatory-like domain-containing protein [Acidobacteriota bacterium]